MSVNPYAPPTQQVETALPKPPVQSIAQLIGRSFSTFFENITLIATITLVVFAPVELLKNLAFRSGLEPLRMSTTFRLEMVISGIVGSLVSAAILHSLRHKEEHGQPLSLRAALAAGTQSWAQVLAARFRSGLVILFGCLLLVVPGLVWAVQYALTDQVATFEPQRRNAERVMRRSKELVSGHALWLFLTYFVVLCALIAPSFAIGLAIPDGIESWWGNTLEDCFGDVLMQLLPVTGFVAYWWLKESRATVGGEAPKTDVADPSEATQS